ncbi:MAG: ATP-dependent helicase [Desulfobacterales bacterium]|nr:ATP-dependent helicase [Desulfobacterales bacterium]
MELSKQQQNAVEHIGSPALVVAGAGSGKTRTLTAKISHLINKGFDPKTILAITFTNKAAEEMKSRLYKMTHLGYQDFPWVRTYHSACLIILRKHGHLLGYSPSIQIFSTYQHQKLITEILVKHNIEKKQKNKVMSIISKAKNSGYPEKYFDSMIPIRGMSMPEMYKEYETRLMEMNSVDFDNILVKARDILKNHKDIGKYYQKYFSYILVDEYQDTNDLQEEITRLLLGDHGNLFCVGDDWQAVYGFRGSNVDHFLSFPEKYKNSKIFKLEENYRSADEIVQIANDLIDSNPDKMDKKCFSNKRGGSVEIHDFMSDYEEAEWTARKIFVLEGRGEGVPFDKIAIIYRTKFCSLPFEKTFRKYRIPYKMMGAQGFFERMEILDINSYLSSAVFPNDDVSFERIINTPRRGIGPALLKTINSSRSEGISLQNAARAALHEKILSTKIHTSLEALFKLLDSIPDLSPQRAIDKVIAETQYSDYLKGKTKTKEEYISKTENLEQLKYSAKAKDNLLDYLEEAALIREDKEEDKDNENGVSLLTIHAAKGLEYDSVFIVGCEENLFPHWRSLASGDAALHEERRLMYVAMTRAERFLFLTHANYRKGNFAHRSRFLDHIEEACS